MNTINKSEREALEHRFPVGCRVKLMKMDDCQAPPIGTLGTVRGINCFGDVMVDWDNGSTLSVINGEDRCYRV